MPPRPRETDDSSPQSAATLSEAADIARAAARQLTAAKARVLDDVAKAEAARLHCARGLFGNRLHVTKRSSTRAQDHAAAIQAAVTELVALDEQVASRLRAAANALKDLSDN